MAGLTPENYVTLTLTVACPFCESKVGEPCKGSIGKYWKTSTHTYRRQALAEWRKAHPDLYQALRESIRVSAKT